ncbi:MAG: FHA domain-containing protein [Kofleriaceae bacterium]|nr:FHA domain-containing protein [Kofleriaceae bacterium]
MHVMIEYLGESVDLPYGETSVGRDVSCAIRFNDPAVSRRHFRFIRREDEVFVEDLRSANGTRLNGRKLTAPLKLSDGDQIRFGSRELTIRISNAEDEERSTLTLHADVLERDTPPPTFNRRFQAPTFGKARANTVEMAAVNPTPQRCPQCAAPVSELDDECPTCKFDWGSFRPMSHTSPERSTISHRVAEREAVELPLRYVSSELEIDATTRDLSESGVFVCTQVLDPVGTECHLTLLVDGGPPLAIKGLVRRVVTTSDDVTAEVGLGVQFVDPGPSALVWIRAVIARKRANEQPSS